MTATGTVETTLKTQDRTAVPEPVSVEGEMVQAVLLVVKLTSPLKPFMTLIVTFDFDAAPTLAPTIAGLALNP